MTTIPLLVGEITLLVLQVYSVYIIGLNWFFKIQVSAISTLSFQNGPYKFFC